MFNRIKKLMIILTFCLIMATTSGCWNNRDITEMSFAVAVGLDKISDGGIELTVQLVKPSVLRGGQRGGGGSGMEQESAVWVFSTQGETPFDAIRNALTTVNRKIFLAHIQLIVIGEDLAREGIMDSLDFFERDPEANKDQNILIAYNTTAKEILNAESKLENIPAIHIISILRNQPTIAKIKKITLIDVIKEITSPGKEPVIGIIKVVKKEKQILQIEDMKIEGAAVFKKDKLVGLLDPLETRGLLFAENQVKSGIINIPNPLVKNKKISIEILRSMGKVDVTIKEGTPSFIIEIEEEGNIGAQQGTGNLTTAALINKLEEETANAIEKEIRSAVQIAQNKYKCDIFGFGDVMHRKYLDYWESQYKDNWDEHFSNIPVEIKVESRIRRSGLIRKKATPQ